ncbi:hypothetical protein WJ970_35740 [Achromobacter xylosoxidans]
MWRRAFSTLHVYGRSRTWRGRLSCVALTAACACPLAPTVGGPLEAPSTYPPYAGAPQYAARGIGALSPVQPVPVRPAPSFDNRAVPLDPTPCDLLYLPNPVRTAPCSRPWPGPGRRRRDPRPGRLAVRRWQR